MYSIDSYVKSFRKECVISINLFGKMPAGGLDYRPTPGQRNTTELLRYLSYGPLIGVKRIVAGDWTVGMPTAEATKDMPATDFPQRMAFQADEMERLVRTLSPTALMTEEIALPWGEVSKKGDALVNYPLKWVTAYRMQLFLYLKAAGNTALVTGDNWRLPGQTVPPAGAPAASASAGVASTGAAVK